jgi:hypothetical protein
MSLLFSIFSGNTMVFLYNRQKDLVDQFYSVRQAKKGRKIINCFLQHCMTYLEHDIAANAGLICDLAQ